MSTSNPLTRADVERILATEHYDYDDANPKWCGDHYHLLSPRRDTWGYPGARVPPRRL